MPRRQTCIRAHVPERRTGVSGQPPAPCQHPGRAAARPRNPPGQAATTARPPACAHARLTGIFTPAQRATGTPGLACHADPVCRSTSEGVERGATHLQQQSEWVAGSLGVPEHAGSRFWLPCPLRMEKAPMASEFQELSVSAEADGSVKPTAIWAGATTGSRHLAQVFHRSPDDHRPDHRGTAHRRKRRR